MPYGFGSSAVFTTSDVGGGRQFTRLRGPVLVGALAAEMGASGGTQAAPWQVGHVANVSTKLADTLISPATGVFVSTAAATGFVYITQTTATSLGDNSPAPGILNGAALCWDSANKTLQVWSSVTGAWMVLHTTTGAQLFFSSSSS